MISEWVQNNIKEGRLQSGGREWVCNSVIDTSDYKRHMSVNLENGLWQCFKSGETGNYFWIYSHFHDVETKRIFEIIPDNLKDYFYALVQMADDGLKEMYDMSSDSDIEDDEPNDPYIIMDNNEEEETDEDMVDYDTPEYI